MNNRSKNSLFLRYAESMKHKRVALLFACAFAREMLSGEPHWAQDAQTSKEYEVKDPRSVAFPVILFHNQKEEGRVDIDALLIFARWDIKPPNQILGIEGTFSDEQVLTGLKKFYRKWRRPANDPTKPPPQVILACQNWGMRIGAASSSSRLSVLNLGSTFTN